MKNILLSISMELYNEIKKIANDKTSEFSKTANKILKGDIEVWYNESGTISMNDWNKINVGEENSYCNYIKSLNIGAQLKANVAQ